MSEDKGHSVPALPKPSPSCPECEEQPVEYCPPELQTDCIVVDSLICSKKLSKVAEITIPAATFGARY